MAFNFSECAETNRIYVESFKKVLISMNTYFYEIKLHSKSQSQACGTCSEKKSHYSVPNMEISLYRRRSKKTEQKLHGFSDIFQNRGVFQTFLGACFHESYKKMNIEDDIINCNRSNYEETMILRL